MRAFYFFAILLLLGCRLLAADSAAPTKSPPLQASSGTNGLHSYISDWRGQPIWYSSEEVTNRTWRAKDGQIISLLRQEIVKVRLPDLREILVAWYGEANSNRTVCVDFYAKEQKRIVPEIYLLLCHDAYCPPFNTKVTFEEQGERKFFTVSGESVDANTHKRTHHQYSYELNRQWQMVEGMSHFTWEVP